MQFSMWMLWIALTVIFAVIEAATLGLTTVWCAIGSAVAAIMDLLGAPLEAQLIVMIVVSVICFIICMIWIKPKLDTRHKAQTQPTNADRVLGQEGMVIKSINPVDGVGQVKVIGQVWSAKADTNIPEGSKVKVKALEGVKLVVEQIN